MTSNRDWFSTYELVPKGILVIGNNASCRIASIVIVRIKMFDGVIRTFGDVRHVSELNRNFISISTLNSKGHKFTGEGGTLKISKYALVVMKRQQKSTNLYVLQGSIVIGDADIASHSLFDDDVTKLWHMHLGHINENGMIELSRKGLLDWQSINKL